VFNDNGETGLHLLTWGSVALANLTASRNGWSGWGLGAEIDNMHLSGSKSVTLTGSNGFDANHSYGLQIQSSGAISASNLTASRSSTGGGPFSAMPARPLPRR